MFEAVAAGLGVALVAQGNAELYPRPGVVARPVRGLAPAELALAWRSDDHRPEVAEFVAAFPEAAAATG
ncbi:LysR substrate-binding domain-containing protein [Streptomyces sp. NPDC001070]